jgi:hypothetical protein
MKFITYILILGAACWYANQSGALQRVYSKIIAAGQSDQYEVAKGITSTNVSSSNATRPLTETERNALQEKISLIENQIANAQTDSSVASREAANEVGYTHGGASDQISRDATYIGQLESEKSKLQNELDANSVPVTEGEIQAPSPLDEQTSNGQTTSHSSINDLFPQH